MPYRSCLSLAASCAIVGGVAELLAARTTAGSAADRSTPASTVASLSLVGSRLREEASIALSRVTAVRQGFGLGPRLCAGRRLFRPAAPITPIKSSDWSAAFSSAHPDPRTHATAACRRGMGGTDKSTSSSDGHVLIRGAETARKGRKHGAKNVQVLTSLIKIEYTIGLT